ncbi:class I SAM-dependent methyltransferase [Acinetobacter sp. S40]|uniref:class I SAM-dependent methyltransferase n=1 Tax=unclassified Acinetobacter TaxID=196816 RepID=UPI00190C4A9E|nr:MULTISPECIES: class I SAM-dependent methyltransferase [unclassified Acinetobacter]MBJ9985337.1 class I SAM-dependent methyltransferase [Acinetobacter sp. S40]MBK0063899.1 class I SAM-dependent methyltransferase [Acinetobacter sp. S55]MBK0067033.1 class I SAM-dependent methyltransferase [Acinetobacter sp. S54]
MKQGQSSRTAEAAAALRANHYLFSPDPIFADAYAFEMTSKGWKALLKLPLMNRLFNSPPLNRTLGLLTAQVVGRSRYAEDQLQQAIEKGIDQYVLVGAGLDSFALRQAARYPDLKIFEVDHPDTQRLKIQKLKQLGDIPANVEFVAIDFEKEFLAHALLRSGYSQDHPAFYSWLGTTHYLQPETTLQTLESIAGFAVPQSEIVLDYSIDFKQLQGIEKIGTQAVAQFTKILREPLKGQFNSSELHRFVDQMGFQVLEDLSGDELSQRYFYARPDHIKHTTATHMLHLILVSGRE